jgi:hypothetical protein
MVAGVGLQSNGYRLGSVEQIARRGSDPVAAGSVALLPDPIVAPLKEYPIDGSPLGGIVRDIRQAQLLRSTWKISLELATPEKVVRAVAG